MAIEKRCFSVLPDTLANMIAGYLSCTVISALIALASSALSLLPRPSINFNNNVCKTFAAYPFKWIDNKNCWENPDVWSDPMNMAKRHGYPIVSYKVLTEDGYILTLFRIPNNGKDTSTKRQPVFVQHGIATNSGPWFDKGNRSIAFYLSELGYDVWIGNARGTEYSKGHKTYNYNSREFWDYSLDQLARYDLSAELKFVANATGMAGDIIYIGHSMGTTISYMYSIAKKKEAESLLKGIISWSPVAYLDNLPLVQFITPFTNLIKTTLLTFGIDGLGQYTEVQRVVIKYACLILPIQMRTCEFLTFLAFGFDYDQWQPEDFPTYFSYWPSGFSVRQVAQYGHIAQAGKVIMYDYGKLKNKRVYGQSDPPVYDLSKITLPVYLFYGENDLLATPKNVKHLYDSISSEDKQMIRVPVSGKLKFNHIDFLYAKDIIPLLYEPVVEVLNKMKPSAS